MLPLKFHVIILYKSKPLILDFTRGIHAAQNAGSFAAPLCSI